MDEDRIWSLGDQLVATPQKKTLYGRAQLAVSDVTAAGLEVVADEPPDRHASIIGWPTEKDEQLAAAQELAARSSLRLRSMP